MKNYFIFGKTFSTIKMFEVIKMVLTLVSRRKLKKMELIVKKSIEDIAKEVASIFIHKVKANPKATLGLATGSSPIAIYQEIIQTAKVEGVSFKEVRTFNLDEYIGLEDKSKSYSQFMKDNLFNFIDIDTTKTYFPSENRLDKYDGYILKAGGIDIQLLGIGQNGHIAFNEPGTAFNSKTHIVELDERTRQDNLRFFDSLDQVPTHAVTMGLETIMNAKEIIMIVLGDNKVETLKQLFVSQPNPDFPASILHNHPSVKVYTSMDLFKKSFVV